MIRNSLFKKYDKRTIGRRFLLLLGIAYSIGFALTWSIDPLALAPQLDAKENIALAGAIESGTLTNEPFYRALLYPALLSILSSASSRPLTIIALGLCLHLFSAIAVIRISKRIWGSDLAARVSGLLFLINPASLFYAMQGLDMALSIAFFLASILFLLDKQPSIRSQILSGAFAGLAVITRPHFLPFAIILPLASYLMSPHFDKKIKSLNAFTLLFATLIPIFIQGLANLQHSGEFRLLPWQGAYNLWAANKQDSNGLYFKQSINVSNRPEDTNPTREESFQLYAKHHPDEKPPYAIDSMNHYWKEKFVDLLLDDPSHIFSLWIKKSYAIINSYEQYNNLTFSFHKDRINWLAINPMNWGVLLIFGIIGLIPLWIHKRPVAKVFLLIALSYTSMLILFYASCRFRLPLVPLLAILTPGVYFGYLWAKNKRTYLSISIIAMGLIAFITFSSWGSIRDPKTYVQDQLLLANANAELGNDYEAASWALIVLKEYPNRTEALRIFSISYFNLAILQNPRLSELGTWNDQKQWLNNSVPTDVTQDIILGIFYWKWGQQERAIETWEKIAKSFNHPFAISILELLNSKQPSGELEHSLHQLLFPQLKD